MKIFRKENDKEVVYVQLRDIGFLRLLNKPVLDSINKIVFDKGIKIGNHNYYDYICFDKEEEINFFRNFDAIINYDEYIFLNLDEIEEIAYEIGKKIVNTVNKLCAMPITMRKNDSKMFEYFEKLEYMFLCISIIHKSILNNESFPMPNSSNQNIKESKKSVH